jgi:hypothetical protein
MCWKTGYKSLNILAERSLKSYKCEVIVSESRYLVYSIYFHSFSTSLIETRGEVNGYSRFPIYATDAFLYNDT